MNVLMSIVSAVVGALLLSMPIINKHVFHTINVDEIVIDGRDGLKRVQGLQGEGKFQPAIDSAQALIDRYTRDTLEFFTPDVSNWDTVRAIITGKHTNTWAHLFVADLDKQDIDPLLDEKAPFPDALKLRVVRSLNEDKDFPAFYVQKQDSIDITKNSDVRERLKALQQDGIITGAPGALEVKDKLTPAERDRLRRFHGLILEKVVFPQFLHKDTRRGTDWASEFIVQTAMYSIGMCYRTQFQLDAAIDVWNNLIAKYPKTIYAEVLFTEIGKALLAEGKKEVADNKPTNAKAQFHQAIGYLERIERNREVAERFPKYKYVDLHPGTYVNVDVASRAKAQIKEKTTIYTTKKAQAEMSGKTGDERSGYNLEDAVRLIGECYIELGETDSARSQFKLLISFFPESDNLAAAQKLIADSYIRDGDMATASGDTSTPQVHKRVTDAYESAVKEYQKFINVYPQSSLISETFIALGDAYNKLGRPQDAAKAFASALGRAKEAEDQAKVQLKIGNYYYDRKHTTEAIAAYQIILNNFLSTEVAANAQYMLGKCYMEKGDTAEGLKNLGVILELYKSSQFLAPAALEIGNWQFGKGNYRDAEKAYGVGYSYDMEGNLAPKMKFQIGAIWRKIGESQDGAARESSLKTAVENFQEVVTKFQGKAPESDRACVQIAEIQKGLGNVAAAREATKSIQARDQLLEAMKIFRDAGTNADVADRDFYLTAIKDAQDDEERAAALYELGMVYERNADQYDSALTVFTKCVGLTKKNTRRINAQVGIARVYSGKKLYDSAIVLLDTLLHDPKVSQDLGQQLQIQLYDAYYRGGKVDQALQGFQSFVAQFPQHKQTPLAYYRIGSILGEQKKYKDAQDQLQIILDKYPESDMVDRAVLSIGEQMANLGKTRDAVNYLEHFIEKHPEVETKVNFYMKIGELYSAKDLDEKEKAIAAYGKVIDLKPDNAYFSHASYRQGKLYEDLQKDKDALNAFTLVRKEDKAVYRAAQAEGGKLIAKTDPEGAIQRYRQILVGAESQEDTAIAMIGIGDVYDQIKKYREAAETFGQASKEYGGKDTSLATGALVKWANALMNAKRFDEAIRVCNEMQKRFPDNPLTINTYYFEATANFSLKKFGEARAVFEKIIALNRSAQLTEVAYYQRGDSYYSQAVSMAAESEGRNKVLQTAVTEYGKYLEKFPKGQYAGRATYMQAMCFVTLQEFGKAESKFQTLLSNFPSFDEICMAKNYLAYSLNKLEKRSAAIKYYEQVIKGGCGAEPTEFAKKELEKIRVSM